MKVSDLIPRSTTQQKHPYKLLEGREETPELYNIESDHESVDSFPTTRLGACSRSTAIIAVCAAFLLNTVVSIFIGSKLATWKSLGLHSTPQTSTSAPAIPEVSLDAITTRFQFNKSFASTPQRGQPEPAWDSLLPNGLGYLHLDMSPAKLSVVSVFHQLHCLYTLRRALYSTTQLNATDTELEDFDFQHDRLVHASHCFEYLRQSLICNADSHVEPAETGADGNEFIGWNVPRKCRDYGQLKQWTEERRAFDAHGFLAKDVVQ